MARQGNHPSTIYKGGDDHWHGRVTVGLTDEGRVDRRHVMSRSKSVVVEKVRAPEKARDQGQPWVPHRCCGLTGCHRR